jgi:integrase
MSLTHSARSSAHCVLNGNQHPSVPALVGLAVPHFQQWVKGASRVGSVTQHRLRATFGSFHAEARTPVPEIKGMIGHKNIATTMIYVETSLDANRRAQEALSRNLGLL